MTYHAYDGNYHELESKELYEVYVFITKNHDTTLGDIIDLLKLDRIFCVNCLNVLLERKLIHELNCVEDGEVKTIYRQSFRGWWRFAR